MWSYHSWIGVSNVRNTFLVDLIHFTRYIEFSYA